MAFANLPGCQTPSQSHILCASDRNAGDSRRKRFLFSSEKHLNVVETFFGYISDGNGFIWGFESQAKPKVWI